MKRCTKCGIEKDLSEFYPRKDRAGGFTSSCKECQLAANRMYTQKNAEARKRYKQRYREENKEKIESYNKRYYLADPELMRQRARDYAARNPEKRKSANARVAAELGDAYIASQLRKWIGSVSPDLIQMKREQLTIFRMARSLKKELKRGDGK